MNQRAMIESAEVGEPGSPKHHRLPISDPGAGGGGEEKQDGQSGDPGKSGVQASGG